MQEGAPADTLMLARGALGARLPPPPPPRPQASAVGAAAAAAAAAAGKCDYFSIYSIY